jgi:hypothetical protein
MWLWYLRRSIRWLPVTACLGAAIGLSVAVHLSESFSDLGLPLIALIIVAATCFLFDEPAVAATAVTPRNWRWAQPLRASAALIPLGVGVLLIATMPALVRGPIREWTLVLCAMTLGVIFVLVVLALRQIARPGAGVAAVVVLGGLSPIVVGFFLDLQSPYPNPELTHSWRTFWIGLAVLGAIGSLVLVSGGRGAKRVLS